MNEKRYTCWLSHTCYVCNPLRKIYVHATTASRHEMTSPCDTVDTVIMASSRSEAIKKFKVTDLFKRIAR